MPLLEITWWELIALIGLVQSVWLLVYMVLRAGRIRHAGVALACFGTLALAFLADFGFRYLGDIEFYPVFQDVIWYALAPLSVLLAMQIAKIDGLPDRKYLFLLALIPFNALAGWALTLLHNSCGADRVCNVALQRDITATVFVMTGAVSLLCLWHRRDLLTALVKDKQSKSDRYWLILALIVINCALIFSTLSFVWGLVSASELLVIRNVLGCGLIYLASTSLFRIYPQTLKVSPKSSNIFNQKEEDLLVKLEDFLHLQKVYQEPSYSRGDLARELGVSEAVVTRLVNGRFGKSFPQVINEKRIEDACLLLEQTAAPVSVISEQVGFNSLPSFNRVFKEITGLSPSEYRDEKSGRRAAKL
jgi:AraC-like DNA-binding protein